MLILNICNNHKKYALSLRHRNQSIAKNDMEDNTKRTHGGARPGAGRPVRFKDAKNIAFRCAEPMASYLQTVANKSEYINECIEQRMRREGVWPDNEDFEPIDVGEGQTCMIRGTVYANLGCVESGEFRV